MIEIQVPYDNLLVWSDHGFAQRRPWSNETFQRWLRDHGLYDHGFWCCHTKKSDGDHGVLLFEKRAHAILFTLEFL